MSSARPNSRFQIKGRVSEALGPTGTTQKTLKIISQRHRSKQSGSAAASTGPTHSHRYMQKFRARSMHKATQHTQCTVVRSMAAAASGSRVALHKWRREALKALSPARHAAKAATCRRDAEEDGAHGRLKRVRAEHAHNACLERSCCNGLLLDEALV